MDAIKEFIPLIVAASLFALVLAVGLDAELEDLLSLFRQPVKLLKAFLSVNVVVPVAAALLIALFPISRVAKVGIMLMAISPVPPVVPGKQAKAGGERVYSYGLYTVIALLAVVVVPVSLAVINAIYGLDVTLPPGAVARNVGVTVLLPLALGLLVHRFFPAFAERAAPLLRRLAMLLLVLVVIPLLIRAWPAVVTLAGDGTFLLMALVVIIALLGGHVLGGPDPRDRAALAMTAATRHPGIALMIAKANIADPRVSAAILGFMLVGLVVALPYQRMMKRQIAAAA